MQVARRSDMDMNGHINNVTYLAWTLESMPEDVYLGCKLKEVGRAGRRVRAQGRWEMGRAAGGRTAGVEATGRGRPGCGWALGLVLVLPRDQEGWGTWEARHGHAQKQHRPCPCAHGAVPRTPPHPSGRVHVRPIIRSQGLAHRCVITPHQHK